MQVKVYQELLDAQIRDINRNGEAIGAVATEIQDLETRLAIAKARETALRTERRKQVGQIKAIRAIINADELAALLERQEAEVAGLE